MQLLIDSTQETPASLRFAATVLAQLADLMVPLELITETPSINGASVPIVLHTHGPAAPIDPAPLDPAVVFGQPTEFFRANEYAGAIHHNIVPAGTTPDPTLPASSMVAPVLAAPIAPNGTPPVHISASVASLASAPPAPTTSQTSVSDATTTVVSTDRDKDGVPWDARVHSETRKMNADGTWRYRRNLDPNVKASITAELRALHYKAFPNTPQLPLAPPPPTFTPAGVTAPLPPGMAPAVPAGPVDTQMTGVASTNQPVAPPAPVPVSNGVPLGLPNAPLPPAVPALGFRDFMSAVNKAMAAGRLSSDQVALACKAVNLDGITSLAGEPGKIGLVHSQIAHLLGAPTA